MNIHASPMRNCKNGRGEDLTISHDYDNLGMEGSQKFQGGTIVDSFRLKDGYFPGQSQRFNGGGEKLSAPSLRAVRLSDNRQNCMRRS